MEGFDLGVFHGVGPLPNTSRAAEVRLNIYNALGQSVRTLVRQYQSAGSYSLRWDGRHDNGQAASSGTYIYRLRVNQYSLSGKMLLIR